MKNAVALGLVVGALGLGQAQVGAQGVGYWDMVFNPGQNLFGVPVNGTNDFLSTIFHPMPDGTTVELWDPNSSTSGAFVTTSTYNAGSGTWSQDLEIPVGLGARLTLPGTEVVTNSVLGEVLTGDGTPTQPGDDLADYLPPSMRTGAGVFLLSSITPLDLPLDASTPQGTTNTVWDWVVGRKPQAGEMFVSLDAVTQTYTTNTFASGGWLNGTPSLLAGQSAFFTLREYVPEPSTAALIGLVGAVLISIRRRR